MVPLDVNSAIVINNIKQTGLNTPKNFHNNPIVVTPQMRARVTKRVSDTKARVLSVRN